jgi:hypothetical protein
MTNYNYAILRHFLTIGVNRLMLDNIKEHELQTIDEN